MPITIIFLVSCIITARMLEKKKIHVASVAYSVLFVVLFAALFLTVEFEPVSYALTRFMGAESYLQTKQTLLYALSSAGYGTCIISALLLTFVLQVSLAVALAVKGLVRILSGKKEAYLSKKDKFETAQLIRGLFIQKRINLIYCRMLN